MKQIMAIIPDECKFHVVSENVNTVDKGSKLAQSKRESINIKQFDSNSIKNIVST